MIEKEANESDAAKKPINQAFMLAILQLARDIVTSLVDFADAWKVLTREATEWRTENAVVLPVCLILGCPYFRSAIADVERSFRRPRSAQATRLQSEPSSTSSRTAPTCSTNLLPRPDRARRLSRRRSLPCQFTLQGTSGLPRPRLSKRVSCSLRPSSDSTQRSEPVLNRVSAVLHSRGHLGNWRPT